MRREKDTLGSRELPDDALYGIHALRARENFPDCTRFSEEWYRATGLVKKACYQAIRDMKHSALEKYDEKALPVRFPSDEVISSLVEAAEQVSEGMHFEHFIVPAISGGAGTSINMNINEIIANIALVEMSKKPGEYSVIDPLEDANLFQSTNDVIPTALRVAVMVLLNSLETAVNETRFVAEQLENLHRNDLRIGYTQMQEAVPSSFGKLFSTYSEALSRDWWRISKCFERIKQVNLGGGAIGTGLAVPRFFIMEAVAHLQKLTGLPLTRSENMADATSNLDPFVEVHAILKAHAVNLEKMVSDLRLLASDAGGYKQVTLPAQQVGSSIMPGKINPVIPEFVISSAHRVYSNDQLITSLCAQGCLELNAYIPVIGHSLIESIKLLLACNQAVKTRLLTGLVINTEPSREKLFFSPVITTALVPLTGYNKASEIAKYMKENRIDVFAANQTLGFLDPKKLKTLLSPENLLKMGFSLSDLA
jgi:aspartate ammonia-lyase